MFTTTTLCFDGSAQAQNGVAPVRAVGTFNLTHGDKALLYHKRITATMSNRGAIDDVEEDPTGIGT